MSLHLHAELDTTTEGRQKVADVDWIKRVPHFLDRGPLLLFSVWVFLRHLAPHVSPQVLNGAQVWTVRRPLPDRLVCLQLQRLVAMSGQPVQDKSGAVSCRAILLPDVLVIPVGLAERLLVSPPSPAFPLAVKLLPSKTCLPHTPS